MKVKNLFVLAAIVCLSATVGSASNYMIKSLGFVAPRLDDPTQIYEPQKGEIVYNTFSNEFQGNYGTPTSPNWLTIGSASSSSVPSGTILPFGGTAAPTGFLLCDGTSYNVEDYQSLHDTIGDAFGGNGSTVFNVPDLRGKFLRGVAGASNADPDKTTRTAMTTGGNLGNNVGSVQDDNFGEHNHWLFWSGSGVNTLTVGNLNSVKTASGSSSSYVDYTAIRSTNPTDQADSGKSSKTGGAETRPKNVYVNYIIKI